MKKTAKLFVAFFAAVMMVGMMTGCGNKFDPTGCVNGFMELITTGKTESYVKATNQTEEEAKKEYDSMIDAMGSALESAGVSEDTKEDIVDIYLELLGKAKYTVHEAIETDDGYEVDVEICPITGIYEGLMEELSEEAMAYAQEEYINKNKEVDQDELTAWIFSKMAEKIRERMENISYGDPQTVTVHLNEEDGKYEVDSDDGIKIGETIIDISSIQ